MVLTYFPVTLVPVAVSIATTVVIVYTVIICVCGKRNKKNEPELTDVKVQGNSTLQSPSSPGLKSVTEHNNLADPSAVQLEPETAVTPLEQAPKQNGTLHSRGNSADLGKHDRHSGTSSGSSPRQATLSRELPDIPIQSRDHSHLHEAPAGSRLSNFKLENSARGVHSHTQLPDIPKSHTLALDSNLRGVNLPDIPVTQRNKSPTIPRTAVESKPVVRLSAEVPAPASNTNKNDLDDYDHITESKPKKSRPRSDYDHVLIEGNQKRIIPAKHVDDPDYAEVRTENIYEGVPDEVTVVQVKTVNTNGNVTQTKTKTTVLVGKAPVKETCVDDLDTPYNKIKDDSANIKDSKEPPYNKIKDDPSYNGIKDITDPYNTLKDDDPYNEVKGEEDELSIDDIDPYNTLVDTDSEKPKRKFPAKFKTDSPIFDPYALLDDDRNVSNQSGSTDPYSRVCDTDIDDPYNKVIDEDDSSGAKAMEKSNINDTDADAGYSTVNKVGRVEYATVNKVSIRRKNEQGSNSGNPNQTPLKVPARYAPDEYSTVMKVRKANVVNDNEVPGTSQSERAVAPRVSQPPEEPPRDYENDDDDADNNMDADHYNTVLQVRGDRESTAVVTTATVTTIASTVATTTATIVTSTVTTAVTGAQGSIIGPVAKLKEPPYTKLSARESLASMNARMASNTYETVSEVDNLYATVEGGSGDGVVRPKSERQSVQGRASVSELYAEIDAPPAPAPPSLDSLHETAKQQSNQRTTGQGHCRTPSGQGHIRTPSDQGQVRTATGQGHFRTPSIDKDSVEGRVTLATEEVVDLDPVNYRQPHAATPDDLEYDPNYETVEEAKSRAKYEEINGSSKAEKKIRAHVYEEVTVTNEARRTKQRVLNLHTYEEVKDKDNTNRLSGSADAEKSKSLDGKVSNETGSTGVDSNKSKKSKPDNEKMKDKGKDKKKSESKDKTDKSGKSNKK